MQVVSVSTTQRSMAGVGGTFVVRLRAVLATPAERAERRAWPANMTLAEQLEQRK